ncbi:Fic family protein [Verminephrobacter eiseniae]|uniref:Fic family protein n=2 Tax=Verminephrobacter eiseniae TaxID=364317 RepID=UPI0022373C06|nr:Fic family protein [Verminephrobacter eiseniae]MCW5234479.1 Fic family protein [Verminephrobacter eiseniae]MCW5293944.1 Fic family protein [Verminephrobacter eiseniae]MCW8186039.1 Fic family protein [Verminephrobacter eiseniae]MCW8222236.1 Fic family protein [Verminephrobacter eiseniae]MCW8235280.1 Fic family protein [Verminephrobacter eiseniae]
MINKQNHIMQNTLSKIDQLYAALKNLLPMRPEFQVKLDKKLRLEFNYNSNHMEGNTLTYGETELLLIFDQTQGSHTHREYEEMKAHDVALALVKEWAADKERPLTESNIKNLNQIILVKPFWKDATTPDGQRTRRQIKVGDYKEFPNSVRLDNGEIFEYASVLDTPILMGELMEWYRSEEEKKELHPVALAALLHYKLVCIHPFDDGNGRISRLLMNYVLLKNDWPPVVIKSAEKRNYLSALNRADAGYVDDFVKYIAQQLEWSLELSSKAANGESIEEPDDFDKEISLIAKKIEVISGVHLKSRKAIHALWNACLHSLIEKYLNRFSSMDKLFNERRIEVRYPGSHEINATVESMNIFFNTPDSSLENLDQISVRYFLGNMKKTGFNSESSLIVYFQPSSYSIQIFTGGIEKKYNQILNSEEIESLINDAAQFVLKKIKNEIGKANS